jgi:Dynein heavy chain, N-terminal region 2
MIGAKLGFSFDPATMTLWKLINMKMHEEARLAIIRSISEIATKEHALLTGIESLDKDLRSLEFTLVPYKNSTTLIVLKLPEVL